MGGRRVSWVYVLVFFFRARGGIGWGMDLRGLWGEGWVHGKITDLVQFLKTFELGRETAFGSCVDDEDYFAF